MGAQGYPSFTQRSAQTQRAGCRVQDNKTQREIQYWVCPSYEIASSLSPRFSRYKVRSAGTMGTSTWGWRHHSTGPQDPHLNLRRMCREQIHRAKLTPEMQ